MLNKFFQGIKKKEAISWAFFDFANSSYTLLILTLVFPIYFREIIAGPAYGDFYWGLIGSIAILISGLAAPVIGAIADYDAKRKSKFVLFTLIAVLGTAMLYFTGPNMLLFTSIIFIITQFSFQLTFSLYDAFLPHVSSQKTAGRISGLGYGLGYIGGLVAMILLRPLYSRGYLANPTLYKLTFPLTALFFLVFSIPFFIFVKESKITKKANSLVELAKIGFRNTFKTIKQFKKHKIIAMFLLALYFLDDGLYTIFAFISIYAINTLSMSLAEISIMYALIQIIAFPSAVFFGWLSDKLGSKKILMTTISTWAIIIIMLITAKTKLLFYPAAILAGIIIGPSQAIPRAWLSKIVPEKQRCEFFGFNGFASKISAILGPLLFGTLSALTGNQRIAMLSILPFFIISLLIFSQIKEK